MSEMADATAPSTGELLAVAGGAPGPAAVAALARLDGRPLEPADRLAVVEACERQARWLQALTGRALLAACGPFPSTRSPRGPATATSSTPPRSARCSA